MASRAKSTKTSFPHLVSNPKKIWFSDPATYPLFVIMGVAGALGAGFVAYKINTDSNVRITKSAKGKVLRDW